MKIERATQMPDQLRGRPYIYPFKDLLPGLRLLVPIDFEDAQYLRKKIGSALYQYKISNKLNWRTAVRIEGDNICVYRLS